MSTAPLLSSEAPQTASALSAVADQGTGSAAKVNELAELTSRLAGPGLDSGVASQWARELAEYRGAEAVDTVHAVMKQLDASLASGGSTTGLTVASNPLGAIFLRLMKIGHAMGTETRQLFMNTANLRKDKAVEAAYEQFKGAIGQFVMSMASAALSLGMAAAYTRGVAREGTLGADGKPMKGPSAWLGPMGAQLFAPTFTSTGQFIYEYQQLQATLDTVDKEYLDSQISLIQDLIKSQESMGRA